jgi:hypothetical protein
MALDVFPFLQLATEIRLQVYRLVLPYSEYLTELENSDCPVRWHPGTCPSIISVSRQIHREATEILYRENTFAIYVRHPRIPRLPMNESRADPESFMLFSWKNKSWASPKNPKLQYAVLQHHRNFQDIRKFYVSLPPLDDLLGVDMYMQKSSYAAFHGIGGWIRKCSKQAGCIDDQESERISYIQQIKQPINEIGELLQKSPRIDELHLSLQAREREISFASYMLQALITPRKVGKARCLYIPKYVMSRLDPWVWGNPDYTLARNLERLLEEPQEDKEESHLSKDMDEMYFVLQSIRARQQLEPAAIPSWLQAMPE